MEDKKGVLRIKEKVSDCIIELFREFGKNPHRFNSEGDIRAYLYHTICYRLGIMLNYFDLVDEDIGKHRNCMIHAEEKTESTGNEAFDILIYHPDFLSSNGSYVPLIAIEIKTDHFSKMSYKRYPKRSFIRDVIKMNKISQNDDFIGYSLILNKNMETKLTNSKQYKEVCKELKRVDLSKIKILYLSVFDNEWQEFVDISEKNLKPIVKSKRKYYRK